MPSTNLASAVRFAYQSMEEAFPVIDHGREAALSNYIVQVRRAKTVTKGGIVLADETRRSEAGNCTIGKVVGLGPLCFKDVKTLKPWPEGVSFELGDFLQIPRYGGFRFSVKHEDEEVDFVIFDHLQQLAKIKDPLTVTTYL